MRGLTWFGIARLGAVQMSLGAIFVLMTSLINRVIAVELALPAAFAGALIGIHYAMQLLRPHFGHGSDSGGKRTPWIIGGMLTLAIGGTLAAVATATMATQLVLGLCLAILAFILVGAGVGAAGTSLLVLIAAKVDPSRRAAAACITWVMMIAGFIITTATVEQTLVPFSLARMQQLVAMICAGAFCFSVLAVIGIEQRFQDIGDNKTAGSEPTSFGVALKQVLSEPETRLFAAFVTLSMFAYGLQDLVLEPFGGAILGMSPAESTGLSKQHNMGVLLGMISMGFAGSRLPHALRHGAAAGCFASALCLAGLMMSPSAQSAFQVTANVFLLGLANGVFAVAAIGSMMQLVSQGNAGRQGVRMGVWGSAQAIAMGAGSIIGTLLVDLARIVSGEVTLAYLSVFALQTALFIVSALLALRIRTTPKSRRETPVMLTGGDAGLES
ncbi:MAG: BCD family MFS transporter [Pseudomonadota bacterium]